MVSKLVDWFHCFNCKKDVMASIVVDVDRYNELEHIVSVIVSAICQECGKQLVENVGNVEL